jgi:outer membrane murein-binding lipoprotein Lpp
MADVVHAAETAKAPRDKKSSVTIDNTNLVTDPAKGRLSTAAAQPTPRPAPGAASTGRPAAMTPPTPTPALPLPGQPSAEEQKWREAAHAAKKRVEDAGTRVQELEAANHKLENDFYAWDDGQYRDRVIKPAWDKAKADLEAARQELSAAEKDLADLPERARKAGALPGWLRE